MTANKTHTPGPWTACRSASGVYTIIDDHYGLARAEMVVREADARLIAAAPKLLEACREACGRCTQCNGRGVAYGPVPGTTGQYGPGQPCMVCGEWRAAIKEAEGEP